MLFRWRGRSGLENEMAGDGAIDLREVMGCTCMRLRRTTRRVTRLYDRLLEPSGLTANQFGLLARLYGTSLHGHAALSIGMLAEQVGSDPTTLSRNLKPLFVAELVADGPQIADRRVRTIMLTQAGRDRLADAIPRWRQAQRHLEAALGIEMTLSLNALLDLSNAKLTG
jgi:DNA-binding MarR family transcriptional regulator